MLEIRQKFGETPLLTDVFHLTTDKHCRSYNNCGFYTSNTG
jgi:hypothetical protein